MIDSAFGKIVKSKNKNMEIHLFYAGWYYWIHEDRLRSFILNGMKKFKIKKVMMTIIFMRRWNLITKEKMEHYCNGKEYEKDSVNDDLEKLFEDIQLGKKPDGYVPTYFLPKLTKEELDLVERKDEDFMQTFNWNMDADVNKAEMMLSESYSKYIRGFCTRNTLTIENLFAGKRTKKSIENQPHKKIRTDPGLDDTGPNEKWSCPTPLS